MKMDERTAKKYLTPDALPVTHSHWSLMLGCFLHKCECCGMYFESKKISGVKTCGATCRKRLSRQTSVTSSVSHITPGHVDDDNACGCPTNQDDTAFICVRCGDQVRSLSEDCICYNCYGELNQ